MKTKATVTFITQKWQCKPPQWLPLKEEQVEAEISNKRIYCRSRVFDRETGQEISSYRSDWYKHTVKEAL